MLRNKSRQMKPNESMKDPLQMFFFTSHYVNIVSLVQFEVCSMMRSNQRKTCFLPLETLHIVLQLPKPPNRLMLRAPNGVTIGTV